MSIKSAVKTMVGIAGLTVLFGMTWLFGAMTVREASIVFQYLFVLSSGFQGFFFFVFICLLGKDGRKFWIRVFTWCLFKKFSKSHSKASQNQSSGNLKSHNVPFGVSNLQFAHRLWAGGLQSENNLKNGKANSNEEGTMFVNHEAISKEGLSIQDSLAKTSVKLDTHDDQADLELGKMDLDIESNMGTSTKQNEYVNGLEATVLAQGEGILEGDIPIVGAIFDHESEGLGLGWQTKVVPLNEDGAQSTNGSICHADTSL